MIAYWQPGLEWMGEGLQLAICPSFTGPTSLAALDVSGNANHGTLTNMDRNTSWQTSDGMGALSFSPSAYADLGSSQALRPTRFTYSAWIHPSATANAYSQVMGFDAEASNIQVCTLLIKSNLKLAFYVARPGGGSDYDFYDGTGATLTAGTWYHIAAQHSRSGLRVFVNSVLDGLASYTADPNIAAGSFRIGGQNGYSNRFFSGLIDDARVYDRALTASEIRQMFDLGRGGGMLYQPPIRRYSALLAQAYAIAAETGSFVLTGLPANLLAGRSITADQAQYVLSGQATGLQASRFLAADSVGYTLLGRDASLLASRLIAGDSGAFNLVGNAANTLAARSIQADRGSFALTGLDAATLLGRLLDAGASAYSLNGSATDLLSARRITADQAVLLATGQDAGLSVSRKLGAATGQFILVASDVNFTTSSGGAAPYYYLFLLGGAR